MIGILLAGGAATRLPNKTLLPMRDLRPVCFSGLDYLLRHDIDDITVITPPNSVIVDVISRDYEDINFIYQAEPTGVGDALNLIERDEQLGLIVMADNVYSEDEHLVLYDVSTNIASPFVTVRDVPTWRVPHLVRVGQGGRFTRAGAAFDNLVLSTPWCVTVGAGMFSSPEGWPDLHGVRKLKLSGEGWWDVGTPDTYAAYWRST